MFLENSEANYTLAKRLQCKIKDVFDWDVNIGYTSKEKKPGTLFISNRNNVKGLEFPFIICFMRGQLTGNLQTRNSIYMMLTRSFITSYFILPDDDKEKLAYIINGVKEVNKNGYLHIKEPTEDEKRQLNNAIINRTSIRKSQREMVEEILEELHVPKEKREVFHNIITVAYKDEFDRDRLYEIIQINYHLMN